MLQARWMAVAVAAALSALPAGGGAADPVCIDGLCMVDRGATDEIALGYVRGGISVLDFDGDGFYDLVLGDVPGQPNRLFRNVPDPARPGNRTFADVTSGSGVDDPETLTRDEFGIVAADYDNDGDTDFFATGTGTAMDTDGLLFRNDGGGQFTNVSASVGIRPLEHTGQNASWVDYDLDGWVDLFVGDPNEPRLFRNVGGSFVDATSLLPPLDPLGIPYGHVWADYDGDGWADCFLLKTSNPPVLLRNEDDGSGGRVFVDRAVTAGFTTLGPAPMGISAGDFDNDGDWDYSITDAVDGTYYEGVPGGVQEITPMSSLFGWGTSWIDVDNDGLLDNYQAGSYFAPNTDRLHRNLGGGSFSDVSTALNGITASSQHSVQIDFNNDGRQDIVTLNPGSTSEDVSVYENVSTTGHHWLTIRLLGDGVEVNRDAIGAVVKVSAGGVTRMRQVVSGSSTTATEDPRLHFGLGAASVVDQIEVLWPRQGTLAERTQVLSGPIAVDRFMTIAPAGTVPALGHVAAVVSAALLLAAGAYSLRRRGDLGRAPVRP